MGDKIRRFKGGDYSARLTVEKNDEITRLEENFNEMAEAINDRDSEKNELLSKVSRSQREWQNTFDSIKDL
jgi:methyl-accepting chemotaxis protein